MFPKSRPFWLAITLSYAVLLLCVSIQSDISAAKPSVAKQAVHNSMHVPAYAVFTLLLLKTFEVYETAGDIYLRAFMTAFLFGGVMEYFQAFSPGRTPSSGDMMLNALGAVVAIVVFKQGIKKSNKASVSNSKNL